MDFEIDNGELKEYHGPGGDVVVPDGVTSIGWGTFEDCTSLMSITLPDSVTTIDPKAFWNCRSLTSITLPDSVTTIGELAFGGCRSLTSITLPDSVTTIDESAFSNCTSLTGITLLQIKDNDNHPAFTGGIQIYYKGSYVARLSVGLIELFKPHSTEDYHTWACLCLSPNIEVPTWIKFFNKKIKKENADGVLREILNRLHDMYNAGGEKAPEEITVYAAHFLLNYAALAQAQTAREAIEFLREQKADTALRVISENANKKTQKILGLSDKSPLQTLYAQKFTKIYGSKFLRSIGMEYFSFPDVRLRGSDEAAPLAVLKYVLVAYGKQSKDEQSYLLPEADEAAALLDRESLQDALQKIWDSNDDDAIDDDAIDDDGIDKEEASRFVYSIRPFLELV